MSDRPPTGCPDDNTIAAYLDSTLGREQKSVFEEHASTCPACRELLGLAMGFGAPADPIVTPASSAPRGMPWHWLFRPAFATAALAVVALVAAVVLFRTGAEQPSKQERFPSAQAPAAPKPPVPVQVPETLSARLSTGQNRAALPGEAAKQTQPSNDSRVKDLAAQAALGSESKGDRPAEGKPQQPAAPAGAMDAATMAGTIGGVSAPTGPPLPTAGPERVRRDAAVSEEMEVQRVARLATAEAPRSAPTPARSVALRQVAGQSAADAVRSLAAAGPASIPYPLQTVGEISFYRVGAYWVDRRCSQNPEAPVIEVAADSPELRSILDGLPDLAVLKTPGTRLLVYHGEKTWLLPER